MPAALTMALLLAEFRLCATDADSTAEVMRRLNTRMVARSRRGTGPRRRVRPPALSTSGQRECTDQEQGCRSRAHGRLG